MVQTTRFCTYTDGVRPYKAVCNRRIVAEITSGKAKQLAIPEGPVTLFLKIDWCRNKKLHVVHAGEPILLLNGNSLRGWRIQLAPLYMSVFSSCYSILEKVSYNPKLRNDGTSTRLRRE